MTIHPPAGPPTRSLRRRLVVGTATCAVASLTVALAAPAAQASDTLPWTGDSVVGANQPYQHGYTAPDVLDWSPETDRYAELLRSHVPLQERNAPHAATQRDPDLPAETQMLTLAGDYGNAFFESHQGTDEFSQYLFNFWQYTDIYAPWHGMPVEGVPVDYYDPAAEWTQKWFEFGMLNLPNPAYTNAAHANGALSLGCIFFSTNDRGDQSYRELLVRAEDGSFPVAAKLIEMAEYFGYDGYFINQEESAGVDPADVDDYQEFLQALREGGMYVQWYDSTNHPGGELVYQNEFNAVNSPWVADPETGRVSDSMFLNYWWDADMLAASQAHAQSVGLDPLEAVYAGVEAGKDQFAQVYDLDQIFDENGDPRLSIATLGADFVSSDYADKTDDAKQWEVFDRERRWWTGSSTGGTEPEAGWNGVSTYIAERSVISGSTFSTGFGTGHGLATWVDGRLASDAEWGDINRQDPLPTWQWWVDSASSTPLAADFDYGPEYVAAERFGYEPIGGYNGGNSLALSGRLDADNTIRLFQTDLEVERRSSVEVTYAKPRGDDSELRVAVVLASDPDEVIELPLRKSGAATDGWRTAKVDLRKFAGERIATIGLTVAAGSAAVEDYQVNVGALRVTDGHRDKPAKPTGLTVADYLPDTDELFVSWDLAPYDQVRRYELYLDDTLIGGGYDPMHYVKDVPERAGKLRLVAVSPDGTRSTAATERFDPQKAAAGIEYAQEGDQLTVSWTPPSRGRGPAEATLETLDGSFSQSVRVDRRGDATATFTGVPTGGAEFRVQLTGPGQDTAATVRGFFADTEIEPYPADAVQLDGTSLVLTRPTLDDWHKLWILEDGEPLAFDTTYSQGERDHVIRGRTTRAAMSPTLTAADSRVVAVLEDYAGNRVETVLREGASATP